MSAIRAACALAVAALCAAPAATQAAPLLFDFNNVALTGSHGNGLGATGSNSAIGTSMTNTLHGSGFLNSSVNVSGALGTATYNGEGHVIGPTLGTSDGGVAHPGRNDTFIINDNFGINGGTSNSFTLNFTDFTVSALSFDWEIFPDATCQKLTYCASHPGSANYPDIELFVDGTLVWSMLASTPANGDPQALGLSNLITLGASGGHVLTFVDWPAEVGIDNLRIAGCASITQQPPRVSGTSIAPLCTPLLVPEPSTLPLAALGLIAAAAGIGRARITRAMRS